MADSIFAQILRIADAMGFAKDPFDRPVRMYPRPIGEPKEPKLVYGEEQPEKRARRAQENSSV